MEDNRIPVQLISEDLRDSHFDVKDGVIKVFTTLSIKEAKKLRDSLDKYLVAHDSEEDKREDNKPEFVDLGLPSGTLWAKYNLGVNPDKLQTAEDWYGSLLSFEEAKCEFDAIDLNGVRMPTKAELEELAKLGNEWVKDYNGVKGLNGRLFRGINGNTLFIPAAGSGSDSSRGGIGVGGVVWSSRVSASYPDSVWDFRFYSDYTGMYCDYCYNRYSVRGVAAR